jgi:hypothetical protein
MKHKEDVSVEGLDRLKVVVNSKVLTLYQEFFEEITQSNILFDSDYKNIKRISERGMNLDVSRNTLMGRTSGMYNFSAIYKNEGVSMMEDLTDSYMLDTSQFQLLNTTNQDEPEFIRRKRKKETDKSMYVTYDAQLSMNFNDK